MGLIKNLNLILELTDSLDRHRNKKDNFFLRSADDNFRMGIQERTKFPDAKKETLDLEAGMIHHIFVSSSKQSQFQEGFHPELPHEEDCSK